MPISAVSRRPSASELGNILKISLPLALGYLGQVAIGITDSVMFGRLSPEALGAAGLALSLYEIILTIGVGMLFPVVVLVSRARGAGRPRAVPVIVWQGLWIAAVLSVPGCAILWNLEEVLLATGQIPALARMAGHYMDYFLWTVFPAFISIVFIHAFTAMGRAETIAIIMWLMVGLNAVLDYVLVFGKFGAPTMGIAGAGLASIIVYIAALMLFLTPPAFHGLFRSGMAFLRLWRPKWTILGRFVRLGWPKGLELSMKNGLYSVTALLAGRFGTQAIVAYTIAFQMAILIGFVVSMAVADAMTARIAITVGRKDYASMWRILNSGLLLFLFFVLPLVVLLGLFSPWAVMLFVGVGPKAQSLLPIAAPLMVLVAFFVLADGLRMITGQALNGLSDMKIPALIAVISYWGIGLPCGVMLGFPMGLGVLGLWWGLTLGMTITAAAYLIRFWWMTGHLPPDGVVRHR
uniref:Multidrug-efflux transporter n=1 Tax=Candidatus Kentrum sp. LFY TaxID=2126342 RepID=A0A450WD30_9GAMM|nr:MAG: multidrug resistance protein, MATE family [Candidatus Kentron sp. LFY]